MEGNRDKINPNMDRVGENIENNQPRPAWTIKDVYREESDATMNHF